MSTDMIAAGNALAATLEAENAALAVLDLPRATGLLADKRRGIEALAGAQGVPARRDAAERMAHRLQALAAENKRLLERAIAAQGRVMAVVARSAAPQAAPAGYGTARGQRPVAFALAARA
ncbi:MAG: hypothetical protein WDN25_08685 [Acetobacteraceae bacterium]